MKVELFETSLQHLRFKKSKKCYSTSASIYICCETDFKSAHSNCTTCDEFCQHLKCLFHKWHCSQPRNNCKLEIALKFDRPENKIVIGLKGEFMTALQQLVGFNGGVWLAITLSNFCMEATTSQSLIQYINLAESKLIPKETNIEISVDQTLNWSSFDLAYLEGLTFSGELRLVIGINNEDRIGMIPKPHYNGGLELVSFYKNLMNDQTSHDLKIIASNGAIIKCKRTILKDHSKVFGAMLKNQNFVEGRLGEIRMDDMTDNSIKALLKFLYYRDIESPTSNHAIALELLCCADKYGIECLEKAIWEIFIPLPAHTFDIKTALKIFVFGYRTENQEYQQKAVQILKGKLSEEIRTSDAYKKLFREQPDVAMQLCTMLLCSSTADEKFNNAT